MQAWPLLAAFLLAGVAACEAPGTAAGGASGTGAAAPAAGPSVGVANLTADWVFGDRNEPGPGAVATCAPAQRLTIVQEGQALSATVTRCAGGCTQSSCWRARTWRARSRWRGRSRATCKRTPDGQLRADLEPGQQAPARHAQQQQLLGRALGGIRGPSCAPRRCRRPRSRWSASSSGDARADRPAAPGHEQVAGVAAEIPVSIRPTGGAPAPLLPGPATPTAPAGAAWGLPPAPAAVRRLRPARKARPCARRGHGRRPARGRRRRNRRGDRLLVRRPRRRRLGRGHRDRAGPRLHAA